MPVAKAQPKARTIGTAENMTSQLIAFDTAIPPPMPAKKAAGLDPVTALATE